MINDIHKLPPSKLEKVVEIIQSAMPDNQRDDNADEVEIPIDELDTLTLRRLQEFVKVICRTKFIIFLKVHFHLKIT